MSACHCASLHLGFEQKQDRGQSLADSCMASSPGDPSPCPPPATPSAPGTYALVWFLQGSSTASCSRQRAHAAAADSKSPRQRASLHQILKWTLRHALPALVLPEFNTRKPPSQPLPCNLGSSACSRVTHCRGCSALRFAGTRECF